MGNEDVPRMLAQLVAGSKLLGADSRNANCGDGGTPARRGATDSVANEDIDVMWVKSSGGDLGTAWPAAVRIDRVRAPGKVYRGTGINPDRVVHGSGIFAGGWGAERVKVYCGSEDKLGEHYDGRTILKAEVLSDNVAEAALALVEGNLDRATGLVIPVDSGVAAAFQR